MMFQRKNFQMPQWRQAKLSAQTVNGNRMCSTVLIALGRRKKGDSLVRKWLFRKVDQLHKGYSGHTNFLELYMSADSLAADIQKVYTEEEKDTYI